MTRSFPRRPPPGCASSPSQPFLSLPLAAPCFPPILHAPGDVYLRPKDLVNLVIRVLRGMRVDNLYLDGEDRFNENWAVMIAPRRLLVLGSRDYTDDPAFMAHFSEVMEEDEGWKAFLAASEGLLAQREAGPASAAPEVEENTKKRAAPSSSGEDKGKGKKVGACVGRGAWYSDTRPRSR